jgi:hypothetical protein
LRTEFHVSRKGPLNCRSLGFARDDKGKGNTFMKAVAGTRRFHQLG